MKTKVFQLIMALVVAMSLVSGILPATKVRAVTTFTLPAQNPHFQADKTAVGVGEGVTFTNLSNCGLCPYTKAEWDFNNDGVFETTLTGSYATVMQNVTWSYPDAGIYSVKLQMPDMATTWYETSDHYITVGTPTPMPTPIGQNPHFQADKTVVQPEEVVAFTNLSNCGLCPYTKAEWDFNNDGVFETTLTGSYATVMQNVTWSYPDAGIYSVKLQMTDMATTWYETLVVTAQPPVVNIVDAKMVSPNELGIGVSVTYPASMPSNALKSLTVQATINGQPVTKTFDITQLKQKQMFNNKGVLLPTTPLRINLKTEGVPRFTDNVKFTVTAVASYEGSTPSDPKLCDVKVLLPVVVIHGYDYKLQKYTKGWVFKLFAYNKAYKSLSDELVNQGYSHSDTYGKTKLLGYRTFWDPSDSVVQYGDVRYLTEAQILQMMDNVMLEVNEHSYAGKVNLVGHSFGGLIARDYANKHPSNVNTVITVGTPHLGTTVFYDIVLKDYHSVEDVLLKIPAGRIVYWTVPTYENALEYSDGSQAYNLFPNTLAGVGMANGVNYFCIYSGDNTQTTMTLTVQNSWTPWYTIVGRQPGLGDGYIPAISASGNNQFGEPIPLLSIGANHVTLMNEYETQSIIEEKLMQFN